MRGGGEVWGTVGGEGVGTVHGEGVGVAAEGCIYVENEWGQGNAPRRDTALQLAPILLHYVSRTTTQPIHDVYER